MTRAQDQALVEALSDEARRRRCRRRRRAAAARRLAPAGGAPPGDRRAAGSGDGRPPWRWPRWCSGASRGARGERASAGALTYAVAGGTIEEAGYVRGGLQDSARLDFSDGTRVSLGPSAKLSVAATGTHGARLRLQDGGAHFEVVHRPHAAWTVEAGPYSIEVTGTVFDVRWSGADEIAEVRLRAGSVRVTGPLLTERATLRPGQSLIARLAAHEVRIEDEAAHGQPEELRPPASARAASRRPPRPAATRTPRQPNTRSEQRAERLSGRPEKRVAPAARFVVARRPGRGRLQAGRPGWRPATRRPSCPRPRRTASTPCWSRRTPPRWLRWLTPPATTVSPIWRRAFCWPSAGASRAPRRPRNAAFFLGRLGDDGGKAPEALKWYRLYLTEQPRGPYASEALGRVMLEVARVSGHAAAREMAEEYLARFPNGTYLLHARQILATP